MSHFDNALKELFQSIGTSITQRLAGAAPREWINIEMARTRAPRADLVSWLNNGRLFQLEFQSDNHKAMGWRMLDYGSFLEQEYGATPIQVVLYIGNEPMTMPSGVETEFLTYRYTLIDIRDLDGESLLNSPEIGDVILSILCRTSDPLAFLRRILERLFQLEPSQRERCLRLLLLLSLKRKLGPIVAKEVATMGVVLDPMEDEYLRDLYERGLEEGKEAGKEAGREEGAVGLLRMFLQERFGPLPEWAEVKITHAASDRLLRWTTRTGNALTLQQALED